MPSKISTLIDITSGAVKYNNSMIPFTQISYINWEKKYSNLEFFFYVAKYTALFFGCVIALLYLYTWINYSVLALTAEQITELKLIPALIYMYLTCILFSYFLWNNPYILEITSSSGKSIEINNAGSEEDIKHFYKEINACISVYFK